MRDSKAPGTSIQGNTQINGLIRVNLESVLVTTQQTEEKNVLFVPNLPRYVMNRSRYVREMEYNGEKADRTNVAANENVRATTRKRKSKRE